MSLSLPLPPQRFVVSASRRTDIPAFHADWLIERLREGCCEVANPFSGQRREVDLRPQAVLAMVLWTRDPRPLLEHLDRIAEYRPMFLVTVTGYPGWLEPGAPDEAAVVEALRELRNRLGPATVVWRYDPVILTTATPLSWYLEQVERLAGVLEGVTDECITSFVDLYRKTERNLLPALARRSVELLEEDIERDQQLLLEMRERVEARGMRLSLCCEGRHVGAGLAQAHCVDAERIARLVGEPVSLPSRPSREGCGCFASIDIGAYDTCPRGCVYCYANRSPGAGRTGAERRGGGKALRGR